ncbi:DUF4442 domain-containing protein [Calidifontibacter sp. DB0510]|uniref:DUF4442 domain-containing protein n=1 Tax=Metallococcus carri TaxID=1656884 RepID=A0A967AYS7_9MICO|nr:hotdog fold domain-containing protein [Metallococcus carri]NHN54208.1 DUF4442 domain-containing protein [Metallococcus carri]NOP36952.1 DUF4442 domain-containing protein [Calidifontibacter sp. DB2511S]
MTSTHDLYQRLADKPFGRQAFGLGYMLRAPYFRTVRPQVVTMEPHHGVVRLRKRRAVQNHIGTMHAIAVANGMEAAMGLLCEATVPRGMRWIPKGIRLDYLAKVTTDVQCETRTTPEQWAGEPPFQVDVQCLATLPDGTRVVEGSIPVWVTRTSS